MPLGKIVERDLVLCSPRTPIAELAQIMRDRNVGEVVVAEKGRPKGIVTDRDIVLRCLAEKRDPSETLARDIMSRAVETVTVEDGIYTAAKKMKDAEVRRIPIVDGKGRAVAVLTFDDIFQLMAEEIAFLKEAIQAGHPSRVMEAA